MNDIGGMSCMWKDEISDSSCGLVFSIVWVCGCMGKMMVFWCLFEILDNFFSMF